jgi:hypothetical protein
MNEEPPIISSGFKLGWRHSGFFVVFAFGSSAGTRQKLFAILPTIYSPPSAPPVKQSRPPSTTNKEFEHRRTATTDDI